MNDDNPHSTNGSSRRNWATKLLQFFTGEPNSREELVDLIQDAEERDLIDNDTKEMIEGVLDVAELKVRDIMVPRSQMVTIDINQTVESFLPIVRSEEHTSELQSRPHLVCRLLLEKKKKKQKYRNIN